MKTRILFVPVAMMALALAGCAATAADQGAARPDAAHNARKIADGVTEKYWKLVELHGQPVPALDREPHLILRDEGKRVEGFGGCNGFGGTYEIDEATSRIRFGQIGSTLMACPSGMEVEGAFHEVLRTVDNYTLNGDQLTLNRARMAPLARFEAIYLH